MDLFETSLKSIEPLDNNAVNKAWCKIDNLTKPIGSLGELENITARIAGITGKIVNSVKKKNTIIMCADNGVVEEGISSCPKSVTATVTDNFTKGITGICVLSDYAGADITVIDIGVDKDFDNDKIINRKISYGTNNIAKGSAMTREQAVKAIEVGIEIVDNLAKEGYDLLGTGEMGVGNTTTSAAILCALSGLDVNKVVGKGAGLTLEQFEHKKEIVKKAIEVNRPDMEDPIDVIAKVGGYDIAGLCGCFIGAAKNRIPIVIDGIISSAAALCAYKLNPLIRDYMFPSHLSAEPGSIYIMKELKLQPVLNLKMRLGEGTGCPLAFKIIEAALYTMNNMSTFEEATIDKKDYIDIR